MKHKDIEDIKIKQILNHTANAVQIGVYEFDMVDQELYWNDTIKKIVEVPSDFVPTLELELSFYKEGDCRKKARQALKNAIHEGEPYDFDVEMVTAKGNQRFVRKIGYPEFENGTCVKIVGILVDISDRKKTEFELAKKNQQLNNAEKMAKIGNWNWSTVTGELTWSDNLYEIYGHSKNEPISYEVYLNYIHVDDRNLVEQKILKALETGTYDDLIYRIQHRDGTIKIIKSMGIVKTDLGKTVEMFGTCQDISDQVNKEQELVKKNQQLTFAEEMAQIGYWEWDIVNDHLIWSDNMYRIFGLEIGSQLGFENVVAAIHPDDRDNFRANAEEFISEKRFRKFMHRIVHKNGTIRTVELFGELIMDGTGNVVKMVGITQDITEQRMSEIKFRGLLDSAPDSMVIVDQKGTIHLINKQAEKMFGYTFSELKEKHVSMLVPERLWDIMEFYAIAFFKDPKHTGLPDNLDFFVLNKSGFQIPVQVTLSPLETPEGLLVSIAIRDITTQKQAAHRIMETNKSLKESAKRLKAQNRQLAEFNHITSHNLRSPVSNLSALLSLYKTEDDAEMKEELIEKIETVTNHLTWTLDTLVESLMIKNAEQIPVEKISLEDILSKTKEMLAAQILKSGANITSDFTDAPFAMYNKVYLESIFLNMVSNSLKYSSENRTPEIFIYSKVENGKTKLEFRDNGLGINLKKNGHKLFGFNKVFHRHKDAKGVGLFLTKAQVDAMGGSIWAESEEGVGTSFFINLNN
ncbi:PAS domain-containing sensor histidine kinase [Flagellimonas pelagia]|uniref:histidine kinase n=1 Tax=Flagellimonas pelagia TaxID=2306998 RepID=A0A3A1NQ49_9FLAO|nr:PAS domain-containing protein [Allomuricauda maritima]RIV46775.1 PAS domain S-box protein [Allomuricauda maritima]TXJ99660.1 PAS domain S-box protein [Allomuricauda maritima]